MPLIGHQSIYLHTCISQPLLLLSVYLSSLHHYYFLRRLWYTATFIYRYVYMTCFPNQWFHFVYICTLHEHGISRVHWLWRMSISIWMSRVVFVQALYVCCRLHGHVHVVNLLTSLYRLGLLYTCTWSALYSASGLQVNGLIGFHVFNWFQLSQPANCSLI